MQRRRVIEERLAHAHMAVRILPLIVVVAGLKLGANAIGWEPIDLNPLLSAAVAANVFVLGFLLAGTVSDFKEAERLPGEVASSLESIGDECLIGFEAKRDPAAKACLMTLCKSPEDVRAWLEGRMSLHELLVGLRNLDYYFLAFQNAKYEITFINRLKLEQASIRRALVRMDIIRSTSFVSAGYTIAAVASRVVVVALILTDVEPVGEAVFFTCILAFLFAYLNRLIRDLDNPYEYAKGRQGSADVSLAPLDAAAERLDDVLRTMGRGRPAAVG